MATLNAQQLTTYAQQAGFSGQALQNVVGIALAESGGNTDAYNGNDPSGGSYGVLQINGVHFGNGTSKNCALDPACAFRFAYSLSNGGSNFQPWSTFTSGLYRNFIGTVNTVKNWYDYTSLHNFRNTYSWATYPVNGIDIPMPQDTPITSLFAGTVSKQYYDAGGGQVIIKADDPSQVRNIPYYYYVHLDNITVQSGQHVSPGQEIGLSGGQNIGGEHPSAPNYSSGPHLELGLSKTNSIPYTLDTLTPDLNPDWLLDYAKNTGLRNTGSIPCDCPAGYHSKDIGTLSKHYWICEKDGGDYFRGDYVQCTNNANSSDPFGEISRFFSSIQKTTEWLKDPNRIIKLLFGILLIGGAIFLIASPQSQIAQGITKSVRKVGI